MLYELDRYTNNSISAVFDTNIYEYDIESAGFNITREFKLLPSSDIERLTRMNKKDRHISIGMYQRDNKEYKENLKKGFISVRKFFFESNMLEDDDIINIRKDAIFTLKECNVTTNGFINFRVKNVYSSYMRIDHLEFFFDRVNDSIDVKGIDDETLLKHKDGMMSFIRKFFIMMEDKDPRSINKIMKFINKYKKRKLSVEYYKTFDVRSIYEELESDAIIEFDMETYDEDDKENLDITYNYLKIIIPMLKIAMDSTVLA